MYRIDSIEWDQCPNSTFEKRGKKISFKDYYRDTYQIKIRDESQPLLRATVKNRDNSTSVALLIPELCRISGGCSY